MSLDKLPPKVKYSIFLMAIFISILIRYPVVSNEFGVDSFFIHAMAESLNINGRGPWLLDLASYFGLYPFSYPGGTPHLISAFSQISGLNVEFSIFVLSFALGMFSFFTAFMLASIFFKNDLVKWMVGLFYSTAPVLIKYTYWTASSRGLLMALMPLILWLVLVNFERSVKFEGNIIPPRSEKPKRTRSDLKQKVMSDKLLKMKFAALACAFIIISFTIHYSAWVMLAFIIVYIMVAIIFMRISRHFTNKVDEGTRTSNTNSEKRLKAVLYSIIMITIIILATIVYNIINHDKGEFIEPINQFSGNPGSYFLWFIFAIAILMISMFLSRNETNGKLSQKTALTISGALILISVAAFLQPFSSNLNQSVMGWMSTEGLGQDVVGQADFKPLDIINTLVTIIFGRYGIMILLALIGMINIFFFEDNPVKSRRAWFLILSMILILPFLSLAPYPLEFFMVLIAIFGGFGFYPTWLKFHKLMPKNLARLVVITFIFSILAFSSFSVSYRLDNRYETTGDRNYIDEELMELAIFIKSTIGNDSFQDPDNTQTTRLSAITGKESRYYYSHDFQYLIWRDVEFDKLDVEGYGTSDNSFNRFLETFYRPYDFKSRFGLPPRKYYVLPEYGEVDLNSTDVPTLKFRYYSVYGNDRVSVWLLNEDFERAVVYD